jgi:predicted nucleic acid-binding protein
LKAPRENSRVKKLRIYLETTLFNYYFDVERDGHSDTVKLFEAIGAGEYEGYTSEYVSLELKKTQEPKRGNMLGLIEKYNICGLSLDEDVTRLANIYTRNNIIPERYRYDSLHIAIASVHRLDCILSYNFEHINRPKTKILVGEVNIREGYNGISICTSKEVLDGEIQYF